MPSALDGLRHYCSRFEISKMETGLIQINKKNFPLIDTVISAVNCTYQKRMRKKLLIRF